MSMISYAQNREDVLLARAFPDGVGFYVDVGAAHPVGHSVTKWFYERGWSGLNVEPLPTFFGMIVADRPRDININGVASDTPGECTLYEVAGNIGMSTVDPTLADGFTQAGTALTPHTVRAYTLRDLCAAHVGDRTIDFLKIDAEGHERAVLAGADFDHWRPRVILVETTDYTAWDHMIIDAGYVAAQYDGLNRYYVRSEEPALLDRLRVPVNCLDDYIPHEYADRIAALEAELAVAKAALQARAVGAPDTPGPLRAVTPTPVEAETPFYTHGCQSRTWTRWPAVVTRRIARRIQRPFFYSLHSTVQNLWRELRTGRDDLANLRHEVTAITAQVRTELDDRHEDLAAQVARLTADRGEQLAALANDLRRAQDEVAVMTNSVSLHNTGAITALNDLEWRARAARTGNGSAAPIRVLFAISSGSQMYSGIGRAIVAHVKKARGRIEYEFTIDDAGPRNIAILRELCEAENIPLHVGRAGTAPCDPGNQAIPGLIRNRPWDAIECVSFASAATNFAVLEAAGTVPVIYTPHYQPTATIPVPPAAARRIEDVHAEMLRRAAVVCCDSPWEWLMLRSKAAAGVDCALCPLGFDPAAFLPGRLDRRPYLLFVGDQNETRKRFGLVTDVFAEVRRTFPGLQLVVAGNKSSELANRLPADIRRHCILMGYVAENELRKLYQEAAGLMLLSDYEAFGLPIIEALASGTPAFVTRRPTVAGLFERYVGAVFVDDGPPARMAGAITNVLAQRSDFVASVLADRPRLVADLSWDVLAEKRLLAIAAAVARSDRRTVRAAA